MRSRPISAYPRSELARPERNSKPISEPENVPVALAGENVPAKARGSVGATFAPAPTLRLIPEATHVTSKLTVAGIWFCPRKTKLSTTGTFRARSVARRPSRLTVSALSGSRTVQKSPVGVMPPLKSWT